MSKSSPLKGADPVLARGAYDAAGNQVYQGWIHKQHQSLMAIADELKSWDVGSGAQRIIDSGGALPTSEIGGMRDQAGIGKQKYLDGNSRQKEEEMAQLQKMKQQSDQYAQWRLGLSTDYINGNLSEGFLRTQQGKDVLEILKDKKRLTKKKCPDGTDDCENKGDFGIMMTDYTAINNARTELNQAQAKLKNLENLDDKGLLYTQDHYDEMGKLQSKIDEMNTFIKSNPQKWNSLQQVNSMVKMVDATAKKNLEDARSAIYNKAKNSLPEETPGEFDFEKASDIVNGSVLASGEYQSLVYDEIIPLRTFHGDLKEAIGGFNEGRRTYADLGVTEEMILQGDLNLDGELSDDEIENIAQAVISNEELGKKEMSEWMVQYLHNQHQKGLKDKRGSVIEDEDTETTSEVVNNAFDKNGNYIPQSQRSENQDESQSQKTQETKEEITEIRENENEDKDEDEDEDEA